MAPLTTMRTADRLVSPPLLSRGRRNRRVRADRRGGIFTFPTAVNVVAAIQAPIG